MSKADKILEKVMSGRSDANIAFADICYLLERVGFIRRRGSGSHVIYQDGPHFIDLQPDGAKVKAYQVRQVREILRRR